MAPPPLPESAAVSLAHHQNPSRLRRSLEDRGSAKKPQRSASFHGRTAPVPAPSDQRIRRPKTQPDLLAGGWKSAGGGAGGAVRVPAKVLIHVAVQRSLGPIQVMASTEWSVGELVAAAVRLYVKEGRRPLLATAEPSDFGLHFSQFSLECLDSKEKLMGLGSRNFFLCPKSVSAAATAAVAAPSKSPAAAPSCSKEAGRGPAGWLRFMNFLL